MHHGRPRLRFVLLASLALAAPPLGCGGDEPPPKTADGADKAEQARFNQGKKKLEAANAAFGQKKYSEARTLLDEATKLNVEALSFDIAALVEKVDKKMAKLWANEVEDSLKAKDCEGAFEELAKQIAELGSEAFTRELRAAVSAEGAKCIDAVVSERVGDKKFADARKLVSAPSTEAVMGAAAMKKVRAETDALVIAGIQAIVAPDVKAKRWAEARKKLDEAVTKGDASEAYVSELEKPLREGIATEIGSLADNGVGSTRAPGNLAQIDELMKVARWELMATVEGSELSPKALPAPLAKKRQMLSIWVEAQKLRIKPNKRAEKRWVHGKLAVSPADKSDAPSKRDLTNGTTVWVLGVAKDKALVSDSEPASGTLVAMLEVATGWVPVGLLANADTTDWVLPLDQLVGSRVWGPLRPPEKELELGTVASVTGTEVTVKRAADDEPVKVQRSALRGGRLAPGTKVLTFCTAKGQKAQITEVLADGRTAKLKCDTGEEKEDVLASLRSTYEMLPATK
jgi:hypothetical protein